MKYNRARAAYVPLFSFLVIVATNTGCATIISGSTQMVTFTSTPDTARIEIISKSGQVINRLTTPTSIELKRGRGYFQGAALSVRASASGYDTKEIPIPTRLNGWYFGNLTFSLVGLIIVDPLTGAMFGFPDHVHIDLTAGNAADSSLPDENRDDASYARHVSNRRDVLRQ